MILIIGGAEQGKRAWAKRHFNIKDTEIAEGGALRLAPGAGLDLTGYRALYGLQEVLAQAAAWPVEAQAQLTAGLLSLPPDFIVICDEVGLGLVPIERAGREYRELVGRVCCKLAAEASAVWRIFCGIGQQLK